MSAYRHGSDRPVPAGWVRGHIEGLSTSLQEHIMGKYFLGWLLGIPAVVLLIVYFFFGG